MPTVKVALDETQYVQVNSNLNPALLQSLRDTVRIAFSDTKPAKNNEVFHELSGQDAPLHIHSLNTNIWALAMTNRSSLIATEFDAAPVIEHSHHEIHKGNGFTHADVHTGLAAGASQTHMLVTGVEPVHIRSFDIQVTGAPCLVEYFEDATTSANGTSQGIGNNNRVSTNTPLMTMFLDPTVTDTGTPLGSSLIPSVTVQGGTGLDIITGGEWILKPNSKYLFRLTNNHNNAITYSVVLFFYEDEVV